MMEKVATSRQHWKQLKNTTFKDSQAADLFNKNFVNLSVDMEKGQGTTYLLTSLFKSHGTKKQKGINHRRQRRNR